MAAALATKLMNVHKLTNRLNGKLNYESIPVHKGQLRRLAEHLPLALIKKLEGRLPLAEPGTSHFRKWSLVQVAECESS